MKDEKELMRSHAAGFGGSDAATVLAIAEKIRTDQPLTTTQKHRVRVIKGMELPRPSFDSEATNAGHDFEDRVAAEIIFGGMHWERETLLEAEIVFNNFTVFAHADFYNREQNAVKECKWSRKFNADGLRKEHAAQLQWYYLCGAKSVSLCYDTADGQGVVDVPVDHGLVTDLMNALDVIDVHWNAIDLNITEFYGADIPQRAVVLVDLLRNLNAKKEEVEKQIEDVRGELLTQMREQNHTKYREKGWSVSRVEAGITKKFDSKKFAADHSDLYASYMKTSKRAESLRVEFREKKGGENA